MGKHESDHGNDKDNGTGHNDDHGHHHSHDHIFEYRSVEKRKLLLSLTITLFVMVLEIIGGVLSNSIALISDAGHMFTHAFAIIISYVAILLAGKPACHHRTFGYFRAEILAAFTNGLFLLAVAGVIIYTAVQRLIDPVEVESLQMLGIAFIGLFTNIASILILRGSHEHDVNIKGVFYHMMADAVSSIGIIVGGIIIYYTEYYIIDPIVSLGISLLIIHWAYGILKESSSILMEMAPKEMSVDDILKDLRGTFSEIDTIYDPHLWTINIEKIVFTCHIKLNDKESNIETQSSLIGRMNNHLRNQYGIVEATIQIDDENECEDCNVNCYESLDL